MYWNEQRLRQAGATGNLPGARRVEDDRCPPAGLITHEIALGDERRFVLDVATGQGWLLAGNAGPEQFAARSSIARLAMLDWCWPRTPVPTASVLWQLELSALAFTSREPALEPVAVAMLHQSLAALRDGAPWLSIGVVQVMRRLEGQCALLARSPRRDPPRSAAATTLKLLVSRLRSVLRGRSALRAPESYVGALDPELPGCFEVDWDRVPRFQVDPREHAVRAWVTARSWSVTVAGQQSSGGGPLWARLVDETTGVVMAEVPLAKAAGGYAGQAGLLDGPPAKWHIDVSDRQGERARTLTQRCDVLARQAVFRAQLLNRFAGLGAGIDEWAQVLRSRADRKLQLYRATRPTGPSCSIRSVSAPNRCPGKPFLAEELLDPACVALLLSQRRAVGVPPQ